MAPVVPNPERIRSFRTEAAFAAWMKANHARETEIWLRVYKKGSGLKTVTTAQALDIALCWGWIDGIRKSFDEESFLQRYTPRRSKSIWSQINREHVARLTAARRMTPHGQRQVDAAKADGRWDAAYAPIRRASEATMPDDLRASIEANPRAFASLQTLKRVELFALIFRTNNMKTAAGRARKIADLVAWLARYDRKTASGLGTSGRRPPSTHKKQSRGGTPNAWRSLHRSLHLSQDRVRQVGANVRLTSSACGTHSERLWTSPRACGAPGVIGRRTHGDRGVHSRRLVAAPGVAAGDLTVSEYGTHPEHVSRVLRATARLTDRSRRTHWKRQWHSPAAVAALTGSTPRSCRDHYWYVTATGSWSS